MTANSGLLSLLKKYGLFLCVPLFLAVAWFYADSKYPQYKVSAKIELQGVSVESAISGLKSKDLVKKAIDQLPLQVKFYNPNSPKRELYGDSLPAKFIFSGADSVNSETSLELAVLSDDQFTLTNNDTVSYHKFNEVVNESFGKFTVVKKPFFKSYDKTFTIKINEPAAVLNQTYNNLGVEPGDHDNVVTVSTLAGNPQKGVDFLNTLLQVYVATNPVTTSPVTTKSVATNPTKAEPGKINASTNLQAMHNARQISDNIDILKGKAATLGREISKLKEENQDHKSKPKLNARVDETQRKIYDAIRPYMKKPLSQFVQVPYVDEIENPDLNDEVNEYNETEIAKQHLLARAPGESASLDSANKKLMMLQSDIFEKISGSGVSRSFNTASSTNNAANVRIRIKEDSLNNLDKKIQAETDKYAAIKAISLKPTIVVTKPNIAATKPNNVVAKSNAIVSNVPLIVIEKPEDSIEYVPVNELMIYGMALLASAAVVCAWWIARKLSKKTTSYLSLDPKSISDKINNLFAEKQID